MQFPGQLKPPVGVVLDCDMGARPETALALAVLYGLDGKNECRVVAVASSRSNINSAAFCEVVGRFYAGAVSGAFAGFARTLPIGLLADGRWKEDTPMLTGPLAKKNAEGAPLYPTGIDDLNDTAESPALLRNGFTAQHDQNAIAVILGPAANFLKVLALPGAKELIAAKARYLVCSNPATAKELEPVWPGEIFSVSPSLGKQVMYPATSIETDFAWSKAHPVVDAYVSAKPMPYDSPTEDLAAVLYAVRPTDKAFTLSEPVGKIRQIMLEPSEKERLLKSYIELASAKPVPRMPRFRRPVADAKPEAAKPDPSKPPTDEKKP